jgi:hypothetical protein
MLRNGTVLEEKLEDAPLLPIFYTENEPVPFLVPGPSQIYPDYTFHDTF